MNDVITLKFVTMCGIHNGNRKSQHSFVKFDGKKNWKPQDGRVISKSCVIMRYAVKDGTVPDNWLSGYN